ncbi:MAG TPA: diguanylate cyclase [Verrucomicrobiae bacterium]|nr:diguanylate cyclase [Verrucomicrobiae bacterium]
MTPITPTTDLAALYIQETGAILFGMVFLFLYRQSRVVYFGLWAVAWGLRMLAAAFGYALMSSGQAGWLAPYATFEFAFVIVLIAAARAGYSSSMRDWRTVLRLIAILPIFVALVWAFWQKAGPRANHVSNALVLAFVYIYNFATLPKLKGMGSRAFRFSLLLLAVTFLAEGTLFLLLYDRGPAWIRYLQHETFSDFSLHCALAFAAMAMWSEGQIDRIREISAELDHTRREASQARDLDGLTGLLNRSALDRRLALPDQFPGIVAVCDMDNFSDINDRYGHLMGDEILRNIGKLLQASIRHEDEAYRWGGDEFVILFHNQQEEVGRKRMTEIEARLREFRVRGSGMLPISFSWGIASSYSRPLRDALDEADRNMYSRKRVRSGE